MSLDLRPILKTSSFIEHSAASPPLPRLLESFMSPLSDCEACGSYRLLDTDVHTFSVHDAKNMWHRCMGSIKSFSSHLFEQAPLDYDNEVHMLFHHICSSASSSRRSLMQATVLEARRQFFCENNNVALSFDADDAAFRIAVSLAIRRLMYFAFCLATDGYDTHMNLDCMIQEMRQLASYSTQLNLEQHLWRQTAAKKSFSIFGSFEELNCIWSLVFMLANALFNCCVALKLSLCTQVKSFPMVDVFLVILIKVCCSPRLMWRMPPSIIRLVGLTLPCS
jgi:hypothetical protein